jgi:hypothetical protein
MKLFATSTAFLLLVSIAAAKPSVEVLQILPSSQNARIRVLHDGNPLQNVKIEVFAADEHLRLSLSTDADGVAVLPPLPRGRYRIAANAPGGLGADLVLDVSKHKRKKPSEFSLVLFVRPPTPPTLEERIAAAEGGIVSERVQGFKGIAVDPAGAGIPQTKIEIFQKGSGGKAAVATAESDATGHFSTHLAKGAYAAIFRAQGFSTQICVFEITEDGEQKDLRIRLDLAPST